MKAVYITGSLGFIGSYVTRACLKMGWYVKGVDKITYAAREELLEEFNGYETFSFIKEDIVNLETIHDCDYVINLAAESHVGNSIVSSDEFISSNINGVHNLLELIRLNKSDEMPIFLHFSTDEVYGDIVDGAHKETDLLKPSNPYSATKAAADQLILAWNRTYGLPYIIVRPTNNYGVGQYTEKLIPKVCKYLKLGKKIPLHDRGLPKRNWLHAKDTAKAIISVIESGKTNEIFNISGDFEQENINNDFASTDVAFVIGANDVTNPVAKTDPQSPIYGMPILNVDKSRTVIINKRSMNPGFAGVQNELFGYDNSIMVFGDAKDMLNDLLKEVKEL